MTSAPITYIEIPSRNLTMSKAFYKQAFGWLYKDLNSDYCYITNAGIPCAFYRSNKIAQTGVVLVLQVGQLETAQANLIAAGGQIVKPIFNFPGGHRFHFIDVSGNEMAVWAVRQFTDANSDGGQMR
jgi:uncharacterized protein